MPHILFTGMGCSECWLLECACSMNFEKRSNNTLNKEGIIRDKNTSQNSIR